YWAVSGNPTPPLATASPPGTPRAAAGVLGAPGTTVLFGGDRLNNEFRSGFRVRAGTWLDDDQTCGIEGDFFFLGRSRESAVFGTPDGSQIVSRPFVNGVTGLPASELVSFPNVLAGTVSVDSTSDVIGGGFNFIKNHCCDPCGRFDWLLGFRYLNLRDDLTITENLTALPGSNVAPGTRFVIRDRFQTTNDFYGVNLGGQTEQWYGRCFVGARAGVALGVSHQQVTISGSTTITPPGGVPTVSPGGLLTQASNIGTYTQNDFAVVPEVGLRVGCQVTDRARLFAGYNFLYWSSVARAGDQIDLRVNPGQLPPAQVPLVGPSVPAPRFVTTDLWMQGVSIGGEIRF
ncbi:MAG: BBP7 family outer membrane beta-barrel protein, partial [Fimbriiglobus sp.]